MDMKKSFLLISGFSKAVLVLLLFCSGCAVSTPEKIVKTAYVYKIDKPIEIDGIADKVWEKADKLENFALYPNKPEIAYNTPPIHSTTARFLYDDKNLYFLFEMEDADIWAFYTKRDDPLCREDVIEFFFKPSESRHELFEFEFNANGVIFDLLWPRRFARSADFAASYNAENCKTKTKVYGTLSDYTDKDTKWVLEGCIPFSDFKPVLLNGCPKEGDAWMANICRYDYSIDLPVTEMSTWNPQTTAENGFARFEDYGKLVFKGLLK